MVLFFARHNNIGPFVVAKDVMKNAESIIGVARRAGTQKKEVLQEKRMFLLRFLNIMQLLVSQFSIVLCYQAEFQDKIVELMADLLILGSEGEETLRNQCVQILS